MCEKKKAKSRSKLEFEGGGRQTFGWRHSVLLLWQHIKHINPQTQRYALLAAWQKYRMLVGGVSRGSTEPR
jgi:hypothetical protein